MYNSDDEHADREQHLDALVKEGNLAQAVEMLQAWITREPWNSELLMRLAVVHWLAGEPASTLHDLDAFLALEPNNAEALARRAQALLMIGKRNDAEAALERAAQLDPHTPGVLLNRALLLEADGEIEQAITSLSDYLEQIPQDHLALARRSHLYRQLGYYPNALEDADACVQMRPDDPETHFAKALAHITLEQGPEALSACDHCLQLNPNFFPALRVKIDLLADLGHLDMAEQVLGQLELSDPDTPQTVLLRARLAGERGQFPTALTWINQYLDNAPDEPYGYYRRGMIYYNMEEYRAALADFQEYARLAPHALEAYEQQFLCYLALQEYPRAAAVSKIARDQQPQNYRLCYNYAFAELMCGHTESALAGFTTTLELAPYNDELLIRIHLALTDHADITVRRQWFTAAAARFGAAVPLVKGLLADLYLETGEFAEALALGKVVMGVDPGRAYGYLLCIKALCLLNRHPEALTLADRAVEKLPDDGRVHLARALVLRDIGLTDEAQQDLAVAGRLLPDDPEVLTQQALTLASAGKVKQAVQQLRHVVAADAHRTETYFWLGYFLLHLHHFGEALQSAEALLAQAPEMPTGHLLRAAALRGLRRNAPADEELNWLRGHDPTLLNRLNEDPIIAELMSSSTRPGLLERFRRSLRRNAQTANDKPS